MRADVLDLFNSVATPPLPLMAKARVSLIAGSLLTPGHGEACESLPLSPGDVIGPYAVDETLGAGGQAVVYLAHHLETDDLVAIKVPRKGVAERLLREASLTARLAHRRIVRVVRVVPDAEPVPYMVLEHCEGGSLESLMDKHPFGLPMRRVTEIASAVLDALAYAHGAGVVHRDIKPANILFDAHGQPKLADLGIGKLATPSELLQSLELTADSVTRMVGTPRYMAPEQEDPTLLGGQPLDGRADLYAVGKLVYHMITGESPRTIKPVTRCRAGLHPGWDALIFKLVEERPTDRFATAEETAAYLYACDLHAPAGRRRSATRSVEEAGFFRKLDLAADFINNPNAGVPPTARARHTDERRDGGFGEGRWPRSTELPAELQRGPVAPPPPAFDPDRFDSAPSLPPQPAQVFRLGVPERAALARKRADEARRRAVAGKPEPLPAPEAKLDLAPAPPAPPAPAPAPAPVDDAPRITADDMAARERDLIRVRNEWRERSLATAGMLLAIGTILLAGSDGVPAWIACGLGAVFGAFATLVSGFVAARLDGDLQPDAIPYAGIGLALLFVGAGLCVIEHAGAAGGVGEPVAYATVGSGFAMFSGFVVALCLSK